MNSWCEVVTMDFCKVAFLLGAFICTGLEAQLNHPVRNPELTCITGQGVAYRGPVGVTASGRTCQDWSSHFPHEHRNIVPMTNPYDGLGKNYCRNPNNALRPWCFTTDPRVRWEYCSLPNCYAILPPGECMHCNGENYIGTISWTQNGFTCQRWDSQFPHSHFYGGQPQNQNYCRNPSKDPQPWCYTTDPAKRWDYCTIPHCLSPPPHIAPEYCRNGKGQNYRGKMSVTRNGDRCKRWSETPFTPEKYPCSDLDNNYCRNVLGKREGPWCFISNNEWEFCNVQQCIYNTYQGLCCEIGLESLSAGKP